MAAEAAKAAAQAEQERVDALLTAARNDAEVGEAVNMALDMLLREWVSEAMASWCNRPDGQRSAGAKQRRFAKLRAKQATRRTAALPAAVPGEAAEELAAALSRECELRRALRAKGELVRHERKRGKCEARTAHDRGKQAERRNSKAAARKKQKARARHHGRAERKEQDRAQRQAACRRAAPHRRGEAPAPRRRRQLQDPYPTGYDTQAVICTTRG